MDPLARVAPGDPIRPSADTQNALLRAARRARSAEIQMRAPPPSAAPQTQALIRAGESALTQWSPVWLGDVVISPSTDLVEFCRLPVFDVADPTEGGPFAIMLQPAAAGALGRALLMGVAPAQVSITAEADEFASIDDEGALVSGSDGYARILWKAGTSGDQWCLLALPAAADAAVNPATYDTIGGTTEGNEAAETSTWTAGGANGLRFYVQSRQAYFNAGDAKWYAYVRLLTLDRKGRLYSLGAETRIEIDVPVAAT